MSKLKNMEMADAVFSKGCVSVEKSFFGLKENLSYLPTNSKIDVLQHEFTPENGRKIENILSTNASSLENAVKTVGKVPTTMVGNMRLDICVSRDRRFAALQLFRFGTGDYQPVTGVCFYEGHEAELVTSIF